MDEAELERLAVKELLREAEAHTTSYNVKERKLNPTTRPKTIRPNKTFLNRTLNSVMAHNKREDERTHKNCRNKLRALEERRRQRLQLKSDKERRKCSGSSSKHSGSANEILSSTDNEPENNKGLHKKRRHSSSKRNKRKRHSRSSSPSKLLESQYNQYAQDEYYSQYFDQLAAYALASKSYYQVGKWLCYQALLAGTAENSEQANFDDFFNMSRLDNYQDNDTICLSSSDDEDLISNCELSFPEDVDNFNDIESTALPEDAVECQLIDDEVENNPPDTIELSDSSDDDSELHKNMFGKLKQKISSAIQEGLALSENLQQQYQQKIRSTPTTPTVDNSSLASSFDDGKIPNEEWTTAGVALLDKYENDWKEISENNERNAQSAATIAKNIDTLEMRMQKQQNVLRNLNVCLSGLPEVSATLKASELVLQQVQALSEIVEEKFKRLQDLCEECDLQEFMLLKQCELQQYKQKKMVALEVYRKSVAQEHECNIRAHEEHLRKIQQERQAIFDECFQDDLAEYRQHGSIKRISGTNAAHDISLEDVVLEDIEPKDALEEFLNG